MLRAFSHLLVLLTLSGLVGWNPALAEEETVDEKELTLSEDDYYELYRTLADTLDQVERNYVKKISRSELMEAAIEGIVRKLDPYSGYISSEEFPEFQQSVENRFGGIGIRVSSEDGQVKIVSPLVDTPAYRAGLRSGDLIIAIEGTPTSGLPLDEAIRRLKGPVGSSVKMTIVHPDPDDSKPRTVNLKREMIRIRTVLGDRRKENDRWDYLYDREGGVGYVRVSSFGRETPSDLRKVLRELKQNNLRGLIIDLRYNPGGLLSAAVEACDLFVAKGRIVSTEGRNTKPRAWDAHSEGTFEGFPIAILVNRYSASASEIFAACLQDNARAIVVGERTWGKGSVQNVIELQGGRSALKLTTASYRRPSGKNIHRFPNAKDEDQWGVEPNEGYQVRLSAQEIDRLVRNRHERDWVRSRRAPKPQYDGAPPEPLERLQPIEPVADRQLQKALDYLNGQLARTN